MPSSWVFLEVIFRILVKIKEFGIRIERILDERHLESIPNLIEEGIRSHTYRITVSNLKSNLTVISNRIDLVNSVDCLLWVSDCARYFLYLINMKQIALTMMSKVTNCVIINTIAKYLCQYFADILASKVFSHQSSRQNHTFIHAANVNFFMAYVNNACRTNRCTETCHHTFCMNV